MHYTLTVDGVILDGSAKDEPLSYVHGSGQIIPGLEEAIEGLNRGDKKQVTISPEKGYGPIDPNAFQKVAKQAFHQAEGLKLGDVVTGQMGEHQFQAVVKEMSDVEITLDFNHPLAGKTLSFSIEIVEID